MLPRGNFKSLMAGNDLEILQMPCCCDSFVVGMGKFVNKGPLEKIPYGLSCPEGGGGGGGLKIPQPLPLRGPWMSCVLPWSAILTQSAKPFFFSETGVSSRLRLPLQWNTAVLTFRRKIMARNELYEKPRRNWCLNGREWCAGWKLPWQASKGQQLNCLVGLL